MKHVHDIPVSAVFTAASAKSIFIAASAKSIQQIHDCMNI